MSAKKHFIYKSLYKSLYKIVKRILDMTLSALLLALLAPAMLLIALAVRIDTEGNAIFKQTRIGKNGKPFTCYKFRTMYVTAPKNTPKSALLESESHITHVGRFLRRTSLDELPQLYNVLRGEMSIVGPRPLIAEEGEIHELRRRCGVTDTRPGITGLAQISGRDGITDIEKARYDAKYARNISLLTDVKIVFRTAGSIMLADEISGVGH